MLPVAWGLILWISLVNTAVLLHKDKQLFSRDTLRGLRYLFGRKGMATALLPTFLEYFSPRFHPWKRDNSESVQHWLSENRRYIVGSKTESSSAA